MRLRGGYNVPLAGRPSGGVQVPPEPRSLHFPLRSARLHFRQLRVRDGQSIRQGQVLAVDPAQHSVPLVAGRAGTVRLGKEVIVLEDLAQEQEEPHRSEDSPSHAVAEGPAASRRRRLVDLGAWQFLSDAYSGGLPDPQTTPRAILVSTIALEPFSARGDVQLAKRLAAFTRGLEHLQSLLEYQPIYLVVPDVRSSLAERIREMVRGHAYLKVVPVPRRYPFDCPALLARHLGLRSAEPLSVWHIRVEGVLAADRALTQSLPSTVRIVAVGGPGVRKPMHIKAMAGYPIRDLLDFCGLEHPAHILRGGALTGETWTGEPAGLDAECMALTVVPDQAPRRLLGWGRIGWDEQDFSPYYLSRLRRPFPERLTTALRGERRACVSCQLCQKVCPAGIWPHMIHKLLYQGRLEDAEAARLDLCVGCGLCSYVCPSKIELLQQFRDAKKALADLRQQEREDAEAVAREEAPA